MRYHRVKKGKFRTLKNLLRQAGMEKFLVQE